MKKIARFAIIWVLLIGFFNILSFLTPEIIEGSKIIKETVLQTATDGQQVQVVHEHYSTSFWLGYIFANLALLLSLGTGIYVFRTDDIKKQFHGLPVIMATYSSLLLLFVIGFFTTILPILPVWLNIILLIGISVFALIAAIGGDLVSDVVTGQDKEIRAKTVLIKSLTAEIGGLQSIVSANQKDMWQKVYDALRYSDPMSADGLAQIEAQIAEKTAAFTAAINTNNDTDTNSLGQQLLGLISQRNTQCKLLK